MNIPTLYRSISRIRLIDNNIQTSGIINTIKSPIFKWELYRNNNLFMDKNSSNYYAQQQDNKIRFKYLIRNNSSLIFNYTHTNTKSNLKGLLFLFKICNVFTPFLIPKNKTIQIARGIEFSKPIFVYDDFSFNSGQDNTVNVYTHGKFNPAFIPIDRDIDSKVDVNSIKFDLYNYLLQSSI